MSTFENSFMTNYYQSNDAPCFGVSIPQKQFVRSQRQQPKFCLSTKNKVNIKQFQLQQKIIYLKIQLQLETIFNILEPKVFNIKKNVFNRIKNVKSHEQINYIQQKMVYQYTKQIFNKIENFSRNYKVKVLAEGFYKILQKVTVDNQIPNNLKNIKKYTKKRHSETLRINSKNQDSLRISDLGIDQQYSNSCLMNPKKKNKQLKKHKQHIQKNVQNFYLQMNQLLHSHEQLLKKK